MTRPFSSSAVAQEKKRKRLARLKKSANLSKREAIQQQLAATQPDALLGYHDASIWDQSKLKAAILTREQVWDTSAAGKQATSTRTAAASLDEGLDQDVDYSPPAQFNFGLDAADAELLFQRLPAVSALRPVLAAQNSKDYDSSHLAKLHEQGVQEEDRKKEQLMRILDLKNANARGIRVENTKRLLEAFGRTKAGKGPDTGSPEVQGSLFRWPEGSEADTHLQRL
jgi:small subunit ribosomal protein S15